MKILHKIEMAFQ